MRTRYDPDSNAGDGYYDLPKDHQLEYLNLSLDSSLDDMARYNDFDLKWGLLGKEICIKANSVKEPCINFFLRFHIRI